VDGHLRVVGAGLDAQVTTGAPGVELVTGEGREVLQGCRLLRGEAEPTVEERGA